MGGFFLSTPTFFFTFFTKKSMYCYFRPNKDENCFSDEARNRLSCYFNKTIVQTTSNTSGCRFLFYVHFRRLERL